MSSDGNLEPGWLNRQIGRAHEEERTWRTALEWAISINTAEQTPSQAAYQETAEWLRQHGASIRELHFAAQDNRCMDTIARSMVEEPKFLGCTNVEDIPLGEYEFMVGGIAIRFTVQCRTIVGNERLVHVVYNQKPSCLGIARFPTRSLCVACMHGNFYAGVNRVKIISQYANPPTSTSHVRRVEL